jgi:hypothetical protein
MRRDISRESTRFSPQRPDGLNQLLPYLLLDLIPQPNPMTDRLCALFALARSFKAVHNLNSNIRDNEHDMAANSIEFFRSQRYRDMVERVIEE